MIFMTVVVWRRRQYIMHRPAKCDYMGAPKRGASKYVVNFTVSYRLPDTSHEVTNRMNSLYFLSRRSLCHLYLFQTSTSYCASSTDLKSQKIWYQKHL